jgi:cysteinyl-tRNA synthetase
MDMPILVILMDNQTRETHKILLMEKAEPTYYALPSPWSDGFQDGMFECTAMSTKYLGNHFDIHGAEWI